MGLFNKNKKPSYRQLEKQVNNGRELIRKVTQRIEHYSKENEILRGQVKSLNTYLALAVYNCGDYTEGGYTEGGYNIDVTMTDLQWAMQYLKLSGVESEDKKYITLRVEVKPKEDTEDESGDNDAGEAGTEGDNDSCTSEESSLDELSTEVEAGSDQAAEDQEHTFISGGNCLAVQGETDASGICATDTESFPESNT